MQTEPAQILQFPQSKQQVGSAIITELKNRMPSQCQLVHNQHSVKVVSTLDMRHQWQKEEQVYVLHNNKKAIITGCNTAQDNRFNLNIKLHDNKTHITYGENEDGKKADQCRFLCGATVITFFDTFQCHIDMETLENNGLWCLSILGFQFYVG